jgi:large subunit ribosomal protein L4e
VSFVFDTKGMRAGKGKLRNRRHQIRKGPLFIFANENVKLKKAVRNIPK